MQTRTDLIFEEYAVHPEGVSGTVAEKTRYGNVLSQRVKVCNEAAAAMLGRPPGTYFTVQFDPLTLPNDTQNVIRAVIGALSELFPQNRETVLVVGLGNRDITPDAIGPMTADRVLATRHIGPALAKELAPLHFRPVAVLTPGVLGQTGMEAAEIVRGTVTRIRPDLIVVIDALAARDPERLCSTVQLCDTGIHPGSGVQNARREFSQTVLGVPVIAIGVPTVVDVGTLIAGHCDSEIPESARNMMVTPKEIDFAVRRSAEILSRALNLFLQPDLDEKTLAQLV